MTGRHVLTQCGTCDQPIHLSRDAVLGVGWTHTGSDRPCIPLVRLTMAQIQFVATPLVDEYKRREYASRMSKEATA